MHKTEGRENDTLHGAKSNGGLGEEVAWSAARNNEEGRLEIKIIVIPTFMSYTQ